MKTVKPDEEYIAEIHSDLLLFQALQRRSFAFELAALCPYEGIQPLAAKLMKEYMKPAVEGFNRVTFHQLERADRWVFGQLAEITAGGLARKPDGSYPVAEAIADIMLNPEFLFLIMQTQSAKASSTSRVVVKRKKTKVAVKRREEECLST